MGKQADHQSEKTQAQSYAAAGEQLQFSVSALLCAGKTLHCGSVTKELESAKLLCYSARLLCCRL
ncbi:hypothetical protein [Candidatus Electronema sp. PJ]|uniref:hypothetical protein n=1 Tax=Candidatus Electronema sp. PJ TaxID=3401572 RepID=UPI003AA99A66